MKFLSKLLPALLVFFISSSIRADDLSQPSEAARQHFRRGIELYEERDFNGALAEFRRAYQLGPSFRVLYNVGQAAQELHDWVEALDAFSRYLKEGKGQIPEDRRAEVEQELSKLRKRVGQLVLMSGAEGAELLVDGMYVAKTPLPGPLTLNPGRRRLELRTPQGLSLPKWIDVVGGETAVVELKAPQAPVDEEDEVGAGGPASAAPSAPSARASGSSPLWAWLATAACGVGATVTGLIAYQWSRDLHDQRDTFPVTQSALRDQQRKVELMGLMTDGLLAGTAIFAGLSLYLTLRNPEPVTGLSLGPTGISWRSVF